MPVPIVSTTASRRPGRRPRGARRARPGWRRCRRTPAARGARPSRRANGDVGERQVDRDDRDARSAGRSGTGIPKPTAATSPRRRPRDLLHGVDRRVDQRGLVETGDRALGAVVNSRARSRPRRRAASSRPCRRRSRAGRPCRHYMQLEPDVAERSRRNRADRPRTGRTASTAVRAEAPPGSAERPYTHLPTRPRGLRARLRGEEDARPRGSPSGAAAGGGDGGGGGGGGDGSGPAGGPARVRGSSSTCSSRSSPGCCCRSCCS